MSKGCVILKKKGEGKKKKAKVSQSLSPQS